MAIADLKYGQVAKIKQIHPDALYLLELGFLPGEAIEIVARSPFNGPISFRIKGTTIALRYEEAQYIQC